MRTFGSARLERGNWVIEAEPHVAMQIRRVFKRIGRSVGPIILKHTDEVARNLLWVTQRYPLEVEPRDFLEAEAAAFDRRYTEFTDIVTGVVRPGEFDLAIPLRDYQAVGATLAVTARGLLIADMVGLGKTAQAIALMVREDTRPALVVTLTHLPRQWEREISRFAPGLRVHVLRKGQPYDIARFGAKRPRRDQPELFDPIFPDVIISNYEKMRGWHDTLAGKIKLLVCDEAQELRHMGSQKYDAVKAVAAGATYRVGLTATPIYGYGSEFWNVLDVLRPGVLGSKAEFLSEWCDGEYKFDESGQVVGDRNSIRDPRAFGTYLREQGIMLRRTRVEVGREMPKVTRSVIHVDTDSDVLDKISTDAAALAKIILSEDSAWEARGQAAREFDWRLRQATGIAKAPYVAAFVNLLCEAGERVVLYGWHREVYRVWMRQLARWNPVLYTGSESPTQKEKSVADFCGGSAKVFICSNRAGAGLDGLQNYAHVVVIGELDWSPAIIEQNVGRVDRDGQQEPVVAYFMVSDVGSDPAVMAAIGIKRDQVELVLNPEVEDLFDVKKSGAVRDLAAAYLRQQGIPLPEPTPKAQDEGQAA